MADIDSLKFSIILDDEQFKKEMERVEKLTEKFEKSVRDALAITDLLAASQENLAKATEKRAEGSKKSHAATEKELDALEAMEEEEQKIYNLIELRKKRESEMGQLTNDEISALKQMESIQKALISIDEKHKTNLAEEFQNLMETDGMTKQQIGSYQTLVTQMQAATSETAKREAMEKAALMMREQKENAILNLKKTVAGIDQKILSDETRAAIQKGINGELTAKELGRLQTIISTEQRRYALSQKNQAEVLARDRAITALRTKIVGIDLSILSAETRQKIEKAIKYELDSKEIGLLSAQVTLEKRIADEAARKEPAEEKHASAIDSSNTKMKKQSELMRQITSYAGTYLSVFGAASLVRNIVRITGEFEAQRAALRAILMDAAGADRIFYQLQELAVKSPYTFKDLTSYAKQLSAFSVPMNEIYDTTKKLADVSAGLGVDMSRIILAYGQIRSASFLRGQEVRQLTEAGLPILTELAKQFEEIEGHAVSTGEVFDRISKRQVPFEMVEEAFRRMTSEGGKFYNMQEVLAETVKGRVSNLQDAWEIMLSKVGDANSGLIKGSLSLLTQLIKNYEKLGSVILEVTVAYGTYKATLAATNALQSAAVVSTRLLAVTGERVTSLEVLLQRLFRTTGSGLAKIGKLITKHPVAAAIAVVAAGVTALILHLRKMNKHLRETDKITTKALAKAEESKSNIRYYIDEMKRAKEGTEEYNRARQQVINQSGNFISAHDAERLSLQNVDDVWVNICKHIEEATKLEAMESVVAEASAKKRETQSGIIEELIDYQKNNGLSRGEYNFVADYIAGRKSYRDFYYNPVAQKGRLFQIAVQWREDYKEAERIYQETLARAKQNLDGLYGTGVAPAPKAEKPLEGWRVRVDEFIKVFGSGDRGMKVTNATDLASYIKKGAEALNDAREALKHTPVNDADYKAIEKEIEFYEGISEAIYGKGLTEFDNTTKKAKQGGKDEESANRELIENIKQEYQDLKELKEWYDKFRELGFDDSIINGIFTQSYGRGIPKDGFASAFEVIATKLENAGDVNGARDIRNYANGRDVNTVYEKKKALDSYFETFQRLLDKAQEWDGTGVTGDISKAIADYNRAVAEATTQTEELHKKAREAGLGDSEDSKHDDWFATQKANALAKLTKLIVSKDDALLKEILSGYDLTNWTDKSVLQIEQIGKALKDLKVPDEIRELLKDYPELLAALEEALRQLADKKLQNTVVPEKFKATKREVKELVSEFKKLADSAGSFAEKLGNTKMSGMAHGLSDISSIAESAVKSFSSISEKVSELQSMAANEPNSNSWLSRMFGENGVFGVNNPGAASALGAGAAWASAIVGLNMKVLELAAKDEERWKREQSVLRSARNAGRMQGGYTDTIFGGSDLSSIRSRIDQLKEINASIEKYRDSATGMQLTTRTYSFWEKLFGFFDSSNWVSGSLLPDEVTTLGRAVERLGMELYDEYGNLNAETLNKIKEQYEDLSEEEKGWIEQAIADTEQYAEAMKPIEEIMNNLFGQVADDMVDRFLDNFHRVGNAVDDLGDTFTNLGETILRSFLHSYIIDEVMSKYQKTASTMMMRYASGSISADDYAKWLSDFTENVEEDTKNQSAAINGLIEAFNNRELINWGDEEDESGSLGSGIKSITEDTANLLASYLNAIRADVSYGKTQWERIAVAVEGQGRTYITLNDYMQQVAANTFDTAQSNRQILEQMRGFIRDFSMPSNMGDSIKVQVVNN